MKAYVFKLNGRTIPLEYVKECIEFESDWGDLFERGSIECEGCTDDNSYDTITVEEIEVLNYV